ncbi:hypothetical protein LTR17_024845 [Elasticomyces elasticus]|nr:hypothetical protein LTR17_024845 [Elasticomyces elasticus]
MQADIAAFPVQLGQPPAIIHISTPEEVNTMIKPSYIVGTVRDFGPETPKEIAVKKLLTRILGMANAKGVLLDMCYKPRYTRHTLLAKDAGWQTVQGWRVVGHQARSQWDAWAGPAF